MSARLLLLSALLITACSDRTTNQIPKLLDAIECDRRDVAGMQQVLTTEAKDRQTYHPLSAEEIPIRMRTPANGYHGPEKGTYILIIEQCSTEQSAKRRAEEYTAMGWEKRIPNPVGHELNGKSSVRCWAISEGSKVFLLTTHAAGYSALEHLTDGIRSKLLKHLHRARAVAHATAEDVPAPARPEVTVQPGDNLRGIGAGAYGHERFSGFVARVNGIADPERLQAGLTLKTPPLSIAFRDAGLSPQYQPVINALARGAGSLQTRSSSRGIPSRR
jgi:hypothetical protein